MSLQKNINFYLKKKNLSVFALEKEAGLKPGAVRNIINGRSKNPGVDLVFDIARQLGCSVEELCSSEATDTSVRSTVGRPVVEGVQLQKDGYIDLAVLNEVFKKIYSFQKAHKQKLQLTWDAFNALLKEVYSYCVYMQNNNKNYLDAVDENLIGWFAKKLISDNSSGKHLDEIF